jgi:hypothetical protein
MRHARFDLTALSRDFGYSRSEMKWKIHTLL